MMYLPPQISQVQIITLLNEYTPVSVVTEDGLTITGFFSAPVEEKAPIVLAFHGNASHPGWQAIDLDVFTTNGYGVLLTEYRGYGGNQGECSEENFYKDARAYFKELKKDYPDNPLILYGQSLGTGPLIQLSSEFPQQIAGIILEVPFDTMVNVSSYHYPYILGMNYLLKDQYRSIEKVSQLTMPKLFILAEKDEVVTWQSGKNLFDASPEPKKLITLPGATHNSVSSYALDDTLLEFVQKEVLHEK